MDERDYKAMNEELQKESKVKKKARCYNCKYAGEPFKLSKVTHQHCEHPKYTKEMFESGYLSEWDTLNKFSDTCKDHEYKGIIKK